MNTNISENRQNLNILFFLLIIIQIIMTVSIALDYQRIESLCGYLLLITGLFIFAFTYFLNPEISGKDLFLLVFIFYLPMPYYFNPEKGKMVFLLEFFLMISVWRSSRIIKLTEKSNKFLLFLEAVQGLILIGLSFSSVAYKPYTEYMIISEELTLGIPNPNQTGIILFSTIIIILLSLRSIKERLSFRFLLYLEVAYLFVLLCKTDARTTIFGCILFLIIYLFKFANILKNPHPLIVSFISVIPLPFFYFYSLLAENFSQENIMIMGKKIFSGRQRVYKSVLENWTNKVFGNMDYFNFANSHNSALTILANIGIVGFVFYTIYTITELLELYKDCYKGEAFYPFFAIMVLFVIGCAETAVLTSGSIYFVNLLILTAICRNNISKSDDTSL